MSTEDLHAKILAFLGGEFVRKEGRQCTKLELCHAPKGYREEEIKTWHRDEDAELFDDLTRVEKLVSMIIERCEEEADAAGGTGAHRFILRTHQHLGGRQKLSFLVNQSARDAGDGEADNALVLGGAGANGPGGGVMVQMLGMQMRHNERYHTTQMQTFQSTLGVLSRVNDDLREENATLRKERLDLLTKLDDQEAKKDARDMEAMKQIAKDKRKDVALGKLLPLFPLVASKIMGKDPTPGAPNALGILVSELVKSLSPSQMQRIGGTLQPTQQILLGEAMKIAMESLPPEEPAPAAESNEQA